MKMKTKILSALTALSITGSMIYALPVLADKVGVTTDGIKWVLDGSGTLTISGSGEVNTNPTGSDIKSDTNKIILCEGITGIGVNAFRDYKQLKEFELASSVSYIGSGHSAFSGCDGLINIKIPDTVLSIGPNSFQNCRNLSLVELGNGVKSIGSSVFRGCQNLIRVDFGNSIETIGNNAFSSCINLATVTLPESVAEIGAEAFLFCNNLSEVRMGNNVKTIGNRAFELCKNLTEIDISKNVEVIGIDAFKGCGSLTRVNYGGDEASWKKIIIGAGNEMLKNAQINYNSVSSPQPQEQTPTPTPVSDTDTIKVVLDGKEVVFDQEPIMINNRVMVPIRAVAEAMGDTVEWLGDLDTAIIIHPDRIAAFKTNYSEVLIIKGLMHTNIQKYTCDVPPQNINGRILTPLRAIGETLGAEVSWDGSTKTVYITSNQNINQTLTIDLTNQIKAEIGSMF